MIYTALDVSTVVATEQHGEEADTLGRLMNGRSASARASLAAHVTSSTSTPSASYVGRARESLERSGSRW